MKKNSLIDGFDYKCVIESTVVSPCFTIAIPTFRRQDLLLQAINSALSQVCNFEFEVIVVDNDPEGFISEEILAIIEKSNGRVAYYKNLNNIGMFNNWTQCFYLAKAEWVTLLCDDDLLDFGALQKVASLNLECANIISGGFTRVDLITGRVTGEGLFGTVLKKLFWIIVDSDIAKIESKDWLYQCVTPPGMVGLFLRRKLVLSVGGFDPNNYPCADYYALYDYCKRFGSCYLIRDNLGFYRIGVNEYASGKVMLGFVEKNNILRKTISTDNNDDSWLSSFFINILTCSDAYAARKFEVTQVLDSLAISSILRSRFAVQFGRLIILILILFRAFKKRGLQLEKKI